MVFTSSVRPSPTMRVAFVSIRSPEHEETGSSRKLCRTARLLASRGHEVTVFCAQWWDGENPERVVEDVRYHAVTTDTTAQWSFASVLPALVLAYDPDVVHAGYAPPQQVLGAKLGAKLAGVPLVVDWHGDEAVDGQAADMAARVPDVVLTPSRLVSTAVLEHGAEESAIKVLPESIDMDLVRNAPVEENVDVVYAHDLDEDANLEALLLALAELRERDWRCVVVGDGPERDRYEGQTADLRIEDRVEFVGDLPLERRLAYYRSAHVFVQTARKECFARELLWALACGCVGVVEYQARSSAHELVEHHERGLRTTSTRELTDAIVSAADMEELDVDESIDEYDHEKLLQETVGLYNRLREEYGTLD